MDLLSGLQFCLSYRSVSVISFLLISILDTELKLHVLCLTKSTWVHADYREDESLGTGGTCEL